ncbi:MAG: hypothetical protein JJV91_00525 [Desulfosarcina sp.]|nr:hypothetical protein [Desulfobacterales bacterium]
MTERTERLKLETPIKAHHAAQLGYEKHEDGKAFRQGYKIKLDLERAKLLTEAYKANESDPMQLKRAKGLDNILSNMTIYIRDEELLVGNFASDLESVTHYPELQWRWVEKATAPGQTYSDLLEDNEWEELKGLHDYWKTRAVHGMERKYLPEKMKDAWKLKGQYFFAYHWEHSTPNYDKLFNIGFNGILDEIKASQQKNEEDAYKEVLSAEDFTNKKIFLAASEISIKAVSNWIKRYAALATEKAAKESDPQRKKELELIAKNCTVISENAPETLQQAVQLYWFVHLIINYLELPQVGSGIRLDLSTQKFYENDIANGLITRDDAQEFIENLYVKFLETGFLHPPMWSGVGGGGLGWQSITIGGIDREGKDACSEMTHIILDAMQVIKTVAPPLSFRWHDQLSKKTIAKVTETLAAGISEPAIFNDKMIIPRLTGYGVPLVDARDYAINNCMWWVVPGKNIVFRSTHSGEFSLPKMLIFALNQGKDFKGEQISAETADPATFKSLDDVIDAYMEHFAFNIKRLLTISNVADTLYKKYLPRPFLSALLDDCIERAEGCRSWVYEPDYRDVIVLGLNNVGDSLAVIKKLVFEEKKLTLPELIDAIRANWKGHEKLHKMCKEVPKFGNDNDYVDLITRDIGIKLADEVARHKTIYNTTWRIDGSAATAPFMLGSMCEATPDGRINREGFHDGSISPTMGADVEGPTATLKSVAKMDSLRSWNHLFNQTFQPEFLKGPFADTFETYLQTFSDLGIHHVQFSIVGEETLQDAQIHPEDHQSLLVRVCGYSAYFIDLSHDMQNWLLGRSQQSFEN